MKLLKIISDKDFFEGLSAIPAPEVYEVERTAVRAILLNNEGKLVMVGNTYLVLPGGGTEEGETLRETLTRECLEEIGAEIEITGEIGKIIEHRYNKGIQESYCFTARLIQENKPITSQADEIHMKKEWLSPTDALALLDKQFIEFEIERYNSLFNMEVSRVFLREFLSAR